uniref:Uncharacterized protein n=1 Tax=Anopheles dirus TaxID=7168 RepID=A0A182NYP1_9DIPT
MVDRFSSWRHLLRTVAYVLRYVTVISSRGGSFPRGPLTQSELAWAEREIFILAQRDKFHEEINRLQNADDVNHPWKPKIAKTSLIYKSCPELDEHGVLRACGRLDGCMWRRNKTPDNLTPRSSRNTIVTRTPPPTI